MLFPKRNVSVHWFSLGAKRILKNELYIILVQDVLRSLYGRINNTLKIAGCRKLVVRKYEVSQCINISGCGKNKTTT